MSIDSPASPQTEAAETREVTETIVAISTPPGRGGIGIVRLSGPSALALAPHLVSVQAPLTHARAQFGRVLDPHRAGHPDEIFSIDDAIVTTFHGPHSYTGEDLVEIAAHGSPVILDALVRAALEIGRRLDLHVRPAAPGEFTQRAFLSGRLDLTQAEAVNDLIAARTLDQVRAAAQQMGGAISRRVAPAKESLLHIIALLEAGMDFASGELDDVDIVTPEAIAEAIEKSRAPLAALAASFRHGQVVREGLALALIGLPNAGKSSLFNCLLARDRAIVTSAPGTTRDTLEESLDLKGIPVRLIDTAGLRSENPGGPSVTVSSSRVRSEQAREEATDEISEAEALGIARSREALADADLILFLHDATHLLTREEEKLMAGLANRPHLLVQTKVDLLHPELPAAPELEKFLHTSTVTGEGIDDLRVAILQAANAEGALADSGALNNLRQQEAVSAAIAALETAATANSNKLPHELILVDLHNALRSLDTLTGNTTTDDILARIFATFCIGK
jgi:tRNA modification GTPase